MNLRTNQPPLDPRDPPLTVGEHLPAPGSEASRTEKPQSNPWFAADTQDQGMTRRAVSGGEARSPFNGLRAPTAGKDSAVGVTAGAPPRPADRVDEYGVEELPLVRADGKNVAEDDTDFELPLARVSPTAIAERARQIKQAAADAELEAKTAADAELKNKAAPRVERLSPMLRSGLAGGDERQLLVLDSRKFLPAPKKPASNSMFNGAFPNNGTDGAHTYARPTFPRQFPGEGYGKLLDRMEAAGLSRQQGAETLSLTNGTTNVLKLSVPAPHETGTHKNLLLRMRLAAVLDRAFGNGMVRRSSRSKCLVRVAELLRSGNLRLRMGDSPRFVASKNGGYLVVPEFLQLDHPLVGAAVFRALLRYGAFALNSGLAPKADAAFVEYALRQTGARTSDGQMDLRVVRRLLDDPSLTRRAKRMIRRATREPRTPAG